MEVYSTFQERKWLKINGKCNLMKSKFNVRYPAVDDLRAKAMKKIPRFAFEYLDGGCNEDVNLIKNTTELRQKELIPYYLREFSGCTTQTSLFDKIYDAPFGIAPVGLQGLMWPRAAEILAAAAFKGNIPFILSTVSTASIETIANITEGNAWFQLYHPADSKLRDDILERLRSAHYPVLVLLSDVPSFGFRPRDIRNGLAMPPKMSVANMLQIMGRPEWALKTLRYGQPEFKTMKKYMPKGLNMQQLGQYMNATFSGRLNRDRVSAIRDKWKGKLVLKGVASDADAAMAIELGLDGIIVSNHGGRQLDAGQSAVASLQPIAKSFGDKIAIMMDSGIRSGPDVARAMACGADFTFLGRSFMYAVAALGDDGGDHMIGLLKTQLQQVLEQLCCAHTSELKQHLVH
jgi:L-lactate dehydrogenase (cytochrome)